MAKLVTDIAQLRERRRALVRAKPELASDPATVSAPNKVAPSPVTDEPYLPSERSSPALAAFERMAIKNPDLWNLVDTFDAELIGAELQPGTDRLWGISGDIMRTNKVYSRADILSRLQQHLHVTAERAEKGFTMMLEVHAIEASGEPDRYYLGGSTPF